MKSNKATKIILMSILLVLTCTITARAGDRTEKVLDEKTFQVNKDAGLAIDHEFGKLECLNWEKNEISVKVIASIDSDDPDKVEKAIKRITYEVSGSSDRVSVRCRLGKGNGNPNVSVDVRIMMPKDILLDVKHKFGSAFIETATGMSKVESEYGNMKIQALKSPESKVKIDFGEGNVTHMAGGDLSISYSSFWLGTTGDLNLDMSYSSGEIDEVEKLAVRQEGGELKVGSVDRITGSSGFGALKIGSLTESLDLKSEYGNLTVRDVGRDFTSINLKNSFGSSKLVISEAASYQLDAQAEYGSIDYPTDLANITFREKTMGQVKYRGVVGRDAQTKATVTVNSEYGSINLLAKDQ